MLAYNLTQALCLWCILWNLTQLPCVRCLCCVKILCSASHAVSLKYDGPKGQTTGQRKWPIGVAADQLELTGWQVMVFRNKKVVRKVSQKPAIFVGPLMLHGDGKFATYHHFLCKIRWRRWLGTTWWSMLLTQSLRSSWRTMVRCVLNNAVPVHMMLVQVQA